MAPYLVLQGVLSFCGHKRGYVYCTLQRSLTRLVASSYGPAPSCCFCIAHLVVIRLVCFCCSWLPLRSPPALHRAISGSYRRVRDAILISVLVYELEPLWTFSGLPTPRFSFVMTLMLIPNFQIHCCWFRSGSGSLSDRRLQVRYRSCCLT